MIGKRSRASSSATRNTKTPDSSNASLKKPNKKKESNGAATISDQQQAGKGRKRNRKTANTSTQKSTTPEEGELSKSFAEMKRCPEKRRKKSHSKQALDTIPSTNAAVTVTTESGHGPPSKQ